MTSNWAENAELRKEAWAAARVALWDRGLLSASECEINPPWESERLKSFVAGGPGMRESASLDVWKAEFSAYLDVSFPTTFGGQFSFVVKGFTFTFAMDDSLPKSSQVMGAYHRVMSFAGSLPDTGYTPASAEKASKGDTHEEFEVSGLSHEFAGGKHTFKMMGGPFTKFGVRVWPEVLRAAGVEAEDLPLGLHEASGNMRLLIEDGKPKKVVACTIELTVNEEESAPF